MINCGIQWKIITTNGHHSRFHIKLSQNIINKSIFEMKKCQSQSKLSENNPSISGHLTFTATGTSMSAHHHQNLQLAYWWEYLQLHNSSSRLRKIFCNFVGIIKLLCNSDTIVFISTLRWPFSTIKSQFYIKFNIKYRPSSKKQRYRCVWTYHNGVSSRYGKSVKSKHSCPSGNSKLRTCCNKIDFQYLWLKMNLGFK